MLVEVLHLMGERFVLPHRVEVDEDTLERIAKDFSPTWEILYLILKAIEPKGVDDADALIDNLMERHCKECKKRRGVKNGKYRIIYEIGDAPCRACEVDDVKGEVEEATTISAEPQREKGEWIEDGYNHYKAVCSECGEPCGTYVMGKPRDNFCKWCGADMRGKDGGKQTKNA